MAVELSTQLLNRIAGWQVMKQARTLAAGGGVLEAKWEPPHLTGLVRAGGNTYRAGLVIQNAVDVDNCCTCLQSRREGTICAHSVAVGIQWLEPKPSAPAPQSNSEAPGQRPITATQLESRRRPKVWGATDGELVELHVILPPNFVPAANKGRVMLVFEAERGRRRVPLNTLPRELHCRFSSADLALLDELVAIAGEPPGMLVLPTTDLARLLPRLVGHPRVTMGKAQPLDVTDSPFVLPLRAALQPDGIITLQLAEPAPPIFVLPTGIWALRQNTLAPLALPSRWADVLRGPLRIDRARVPAFLNQDWPSMLAGGGVTADFQLEDFTLDFIEPKLRLHLAGGLARLDATLHAVYGGRAFPAAKLAAGETPWTPDPAVPTRYTARDLGNEQAAVGRLVRSGFTAPDGEGRCRLQGEDAVLNFFAREFPRLRQVWEITLEERLDRSTTTKLERIEPTFRVTPSGEQWFDLQVTFASASGERFAPADIQRLILSGHSHTRLRNGRIAVLDTGAVEELQQVLLDCDPQQQSGGYRIATNQAGFLEATLRDQPGWAVQAPTAWRDRVRTQSGETKLECPPLGSLETILRPYQKEGVAWLRFLRRHGFGGILADEMGLGKTVQVLAHLALLKSESATLEGGSAGASPAPPGDPQSGTGLRLVTSKQADFVSDVRPAAPTRVSPPSLVVCPTSLVHNWVAEAEKFTPHLRVLALDGPDRHTRFNQISGSDLVVTSYALMRRDADRYGVVEFDTVVLDEAQHIKNRQTQNAQAVKAVPARHRLVLTGTPLENSVLDLWSIFDFLMPGYLGSATDFRERYEQPITRDRETVAQARLARRVRPFLRRRLKREVAADLPAKLEQVAYCDLTPTQAAVYRQLLDTGRREVLSAADGPANARGRMVVLTTLLRLRQVCCDLRLLDLPDSEPTEVSAKLDMFAELLEEVLDGGHRVLVFSQFTSMLALLRERLEADGVAYCYLDGATPDRAAVVRRFQTQADLPVFLISLKAGGTGLNLSAADTVIHFDPWWNPAVEAQATDRAHRLGQTRVVTSYKLIARGTVEEKILQLQARKRETLQAMLGDEEQLVGSLNWDEIQELLSV